MSCVLNAPYLYLKDEVPPMENEDHVEIKAEHVTVHTGWTPKMVLWNTIGTVAGALVGFASLILSAVAIYIAMTK